MSIMCITTVASYKTPVQKDVNVLMIAQSFGSHDSTNLRKYIPKRSGGQIFIRNRLFSAVRMIRVDNND